MVAVGGKSFRVSGQHQEVMPSSGMGAGATFLLGGFPTMTQLHTASGHSANVLPTQPAPPQQTGTPSSSFLLRLSSYSNPGDSLCLLLRDMGKEYFPLLNDSRSFPWKRLHSHSEVMLVHPIH